MNYIKKYVSHDTSRSDESKHACCILTRDRFHEDIRIFLKFTAVLHVNRRIRKEIHWPVDQRTKENRKDVAPIAIITLIAKL